MQPAPGPWSPMGPPSYNNPQPVSTVTCNILSVLLGFV